MNAKTCTDCGRMYAYTRESDRCSECDAKAPTNIVATTKFFADRWTIREYADGMYDAAENNGPGLSYGLESFDKAVEWVCEQEAARAILEHDATQAEPKPGPVAVELDEAQADLLYGMLTQRLYLRLDDPERELVSQTREALYPATSAQREYNEAHRLASEALAASPKRRDLGPGLGGGNPHTLDIAHAEQARREAADAAALEAARRDRERG